MSKLKPYYADIYNEYQAGDTSYHKLANKYAKKIKKPVSHTAIGNIIKKFEDEFNKLAKTNKELANKEQQLEKLDTQKERHEIYSEIKGIFDRVIQSKKAKNRDASIMIVAGELIKVLNSIDGGHKLQIIIANELNIDNSKHQTVNFQLHIEEDEFAQWIYNELLNYEQRRRWDKKMEELDGKDKGG